MKISSRELLKRVRAWIRAEHYFRGPMIYGGESQENLVRAEEDLRELVTGTRGLNGAAEYMNLPFELDEEKKSKPKRKKKKRVQRASTQRKKAKKKRSTPRVFFD